MKILSALVFFALLGCVGPETLDELEDQALISGDWTEVEKREQMLRRKSMKDGPDCADGLTSVCYEQGMSMNCECIRAKPRGRLSTN